MARQLMDVTGMRFGKLTVLRMADDGRHGEKRWVCRCDCGREKAVRGNDLRSGRIKSCGCIGRGIHDDKVGSRYGVLTVIGEERKAGSKLDTLYRCRCDCGREVVMPGRLLRHSAPHKTCGRGCALKAELERAKPAPRDAGIEMRKPKTVEPGVRHGHWTVVRRSQDGKAWVVRCDCGNERLMTGAEFLAGTDSSCGCPQYRWDDPAEAASWMRYWDRTWENNKRRRGKR